MTDRNELTFFHSPQTRSFGVLALLNELQADYTLHALNMKAGEQRLPEYLAVNPMGKVPAILHRGVLVTEQVAVYQYLAELFPASGLAPAIGDPLRGPFLRWLAFYGSSFEPALVDKSQGHAPSPAMAPYGDYETMLQTLVEQLGGGPYILGDRFTAADMLWGTALGWTTMFKLVPTLPVITDYIARIEARPSIAAARAKDAELLASFA